MVTIRFTRNIRYDDLAALVLSLLNANRRDISASRQFSTPVGHISKSMLASSVQSQGNPIETFDRELREPKIAEVQLLSRPANGSRGRFACQVSHSSRFRSLGFHDVVLPLDWRQIDEPQRRIDQIAKLPYEDSRRDRPGSLIQINPAKRETVGIKHPAA
jgi:hypothetical protein